MLGESMQSNTTPVKTTIDLRTSQSDINILTLNLLYSVDFSN